MFSTLDKEGVGRRSASSIYFDVNNDDVNELLNQIELEGDAWVEFTGHCLQEGDGEYILWGIGSIVNDEAWSAICDSLKTHPTLEVVNLFVTLRDATTTPAVLKPDTSTRGYAESKQVDTQNTFA
jgi:hypothetical protein